MAEEAKTIVLDDADAHTAGGYTQVPNYLLKHQQISLGGKITYSMLLSYAWYNDYCFPGQETLSRDIGCSKNSVGTYLKDLSDGKYLHVKQQGFGKPNIYRLYLKALLNRKAAGSDVDVADDEGKTIILTGADAFTRSGYTLIPNIVLKSGGISPGAKLTYAMLLSYAWHNDYCFPGQETLAHDIGCGKRSVGRYLKELSEARLIDVKQQGLGKPNIYWLFCKAPETKK